MKKLFLKIISARRKHFILFIFDVLCFFAVTFFYYLIARHAANSMPVDDSLAFLVNAVTQLVLISLFRVLSGNYANVWRYPNVRAYFFLVISDAAASVLSIFVIRIANYAYTGMYNGLWQAATIGSLVCLAALMARFTYSLIYVGMTRKRVGDIEKRPVAIVGAGSLGSSLASELKNSPNSVYNPVFFIDNDRGKIGNRVSSLPVYDFDHARSLIKKLDVQEVIIAIANKSRDELYELYNLYSALDCKVRVFDSIIGGDRMDQNKIRDFSIEDLLSREPVDFEAGKEYYRGKTVLVTGGGGSIGSEICRQVAKCGPEKLIIFDIYENNAYDIQQELCEIYGGSLDLRVEIGSVRDIDRLDEVFDTYRPQVIFHAAAHKHVPLMEHSCAEAIKNNVIGTYNAADMAEKYGAEKFILISTDKAVNPTNVMGASKRVCEMVIQCRTDSRTCFAAVRFGNVLGSNGSVIPLFKRQIAQGGPVTVTDKRIVRYFMTIPEASQLVMLAGKMAKRGELFVLDMGVPVKIYDLAVNMIRLSGLVPDKDIKIEEVGLRPGEKLYEELLVKTEELDKTENGLIFVERDTPCTRAEVDRRISVLMQAVNDHGDIKAAIAEVVPTYRDPDEVNKIAAEAEEMKLAGKQ